MMSKHSVCVVFFMLISLQVICYEKTLRKIVRNQSKMVQRPFSDTGGSQSLMWTNSSGHQLIREAVRIPGFTQINAMIHKIRRPKMSTMLSSIETSRGKSAYNDIKSSSNTMNELRLTRNTYLNTSVQTAFRPFVFKAPVDLSINDLQSKNSLQNISVDTYYAMPALSSKFFPPLNEQDLQGIELKTVNSKESTITFPEIPEIRENKTIQIKSMYLSNKNASESLDNVKNSLVDIDADDSDKVDYFLQATPVDAGLMYNYNSSVNLYSCTRIKEAKTDIDAQELFASLDIEPKWVEQKQFWNSIYDSRYESLMRSPKWPALKVILVPTTHVDSVWRKTFNQYHNESVSKILSNVVKKLQYYSNLTFTWNEVSHLSQWWKRTSQKSRSAFRKLLKSGRLELTTGAWVEPDEATTHLFGLVHLLIQGHEWLKHHLNYAPKVGWLTNSVAHSPTMSYLLYASDIKRLVLTNLHYSWQEYLAEYQHSDFVWVQNWDTDMTVPTALNEALGLLGIQRHPKNSVLTHYLQFNSATFTACGPNSGVCANDFNFAKPNKNLDINPFNVKDKAERLLEQYSKTGTITPHNVIIAPIGGPYRYENQPEFDYQYNNYQKIADFVNANQNIYKATIEFGTPKDYFSSILTKHKKYVSLKGDFLNYADIDSGCPAYWTGFYTSRPFFKIMLRRLESTLRTTEILFSFALTFNTFRGYNASYIFDELVKVRETFARLLDRNVASGTLPANVLRHVHNLILDTVKSCWHVQEVAASLLSSKQGNFEPHLQKYVYREGEFISTFRTVSANDQIYIFNSLSHERTEVVELITRYSNIRIVDHKKKEITVQINPIWKYNSDNQIIISRQFFKVSFAVVIPPMTLELFTIKDTYDVTHSASTIFCSSCMVNDAAISDSIFPFNIQPIQTGDIQLESYKHRLIFDELTGFLKTVIEKETNIEKSVVIDFGAFKDSSVNSGMFLFSTNVSKPLNDVLMSYRIGALVKATIIISGQITTEISSVYGRLLQQTIKVFNFIQSPLANAIYVENKVDYEISPKNRELEFFMSIQTDISNGNPPVIFTDNNGFQHTPKILNMSRRVESNMYPITTMAFLQDRRSRLTYITDHAQGVTALQEGQLIVMLDRRILYNDGRGTGEGLADSSATCHRQFIVLENFMQTEIPGVEANQHDLELPSLSAVHLSNSLNYHLDIFVVNKNKSEQSQYAFFPLIKTSFPCDVAVINYRVVLTKGGFLYNNPNSALLILQRRSISCRVAMPNNMHCNGESQFSLDKILRNLRAVYQTNLAGTNKGIPLLNFSPVNFPAMELTTLRVFY